MRTIAEIFGAGEQKMLDIGPCPVGLHREQQRHCYHLHSRFMLDAIQKCSRAVIQLELRKKSEREASSFGRDALNGFNCVTSFDVEQGIARLSPASILFMMI